MFAATAVMADGDLSLARCRAGDLGCDAPPARDLVCPEVVTHAYNQVTGDARDFPTACLPAGWALTPPGSLVNQNRDAAVNFVTNLYRTIFGREPDPGGLDFWVDNLLNQGGTQGSVTQAFRDAQAKELAQKQAAAVVKQATTTATTTAAAKAVSAPQSNALPWLIGTGVILFLLSQ